MVLLSKLLCFMKRKEFNALERELRRPAFRFFEGWPQQERREKFGCLGQDDLIDFGNLLFMEFVSVLEAQNCQSTCSMLDDWSSGQYCRIENRLGNTFAAVGCSMGGWRGHMDSELEGYIDIEEDVRSSLPVFIVTGDIDVYREPCERARHIFSAAGHPVTFRLLPNTPHLQPHLLGFIFPFLIVWLCFFALSD